MTHFLFTDTVLQREGFLLKFTARPNYNIKTSKTALKGYAQIQEAILKESINISLHFPNFRGEHNGQRLGGNELGNQSSESKGKQRQILRFPSH